MPKKAVELSLNTVIIAALVLIVLIVLIIIFTHYSGNLVQGLDDCKTKGANPPSDCRPTASQCVQEGGIPSGQCIYYSDSGQKITSSQSQVCCVFRK